MGRATRVVLRSLAGAPVRVRCGGQVRDVQLGKGESLEWRMQ